MHITEMNSCCSVIELGDLYGTRMTQAEFIKEIAEFIYDNYGNYHTGVDLKEISTCIIATTHIEQTYMANLLKKNKFKNIPFYGRHQSGSIEKTGKRNKYMSFWIRTSLPPGVRTILRQLYKRT